MLCMRLWNKLHFVTEITWWTWLKVGGEGKALIVNFTTTLEQVMIYKSTWPIKIKETGRFDIWTFFVPLLSSICFHCLLTVYYTQKRTGEELKMAQYQISYSVNKQRLSVNTAIATDIFADHDFVSFFK